MLELSWIQFQSISPSSQKEKNLEDFRRPVVGLGDDSESKNTFISCRGPGFDSQNSYGGLQHSITQVVENPPPFTTSMGIRHTVHFMPIQAGKTQNIK